MPRKTTSKSAPVVKVTTAKPAAKKRSARASPKLSTAAWIGFILAGVVVGTGLAVFAVRYRLFSARIISGMVLVLGIALAAWFLRTKKREPRWALVGGGIAAIGASQLMFQTLAQPRNADEAGGLQELRERLVEALDDQNDNNDNNADADDDDDE